MEKSRFYLILALAAAFMLYCLFVRGFIAASAFLPRL
jgi:hypothetical protein